MFSVAYATLWVRNQLLRRKSLESSSLVGSKAMMKGMTGLGISGLLYGRGATLWDTWLSGCLPGSSLQW